MTEAHPHGSTEGLAAAVAAALTDWEGALPPVDADRPQPAHLTFTSSTEARTIALDSQRISALWTMVTAAHQTNLARAARAARITAMADVLVKARRKEPGADIGWTISGALNTAANRLLHPWYLVIGRPGSWEASIVMRMVQAGDDIYHDAEGRDSVYELADLFVEMGNTVSTGSPEDGGDTLSQAIAAAVGQLGSMEAFVGDSEWGDVLSALGGNHTSTDDAWDGS